MSRELLIAQIDSVPWSTPREQIHEAIEAFFASYPLKGEGGAESRAALFADDFQFEDPVGTDPVVDREALIQVFKFPPELGLTINMQSQRIIITGDEAISLTESTIGMEGQEPARLSIVHNFAFTADGKIKRVRIFFDKDSIQ